MHQYVNWMLNLQSFLTSTRLLVEVERLSRLVPPHGIAGLPRFFFTVQGKWLKHQEVAALQDYRLGYRV